VKRSPSPTSARMGALHLWPSSMPEESQSSSSPEAAPQAESQKDTADDAAEDEETEESPAAKRQRTAKAFDLQDLKKQLAELQAKPPAYASKIGELTTPPLICDDQGQLRKPENPEENGPWDLQLCIEGEDGDEAYGVPWRVNIRFDPELWPAKLPLVRFRGVFHHAFTDENNAMLMPFYRALPRDESQACTLRLTVEAIHTFLVDPFAAWKLSPDKVPEKLVRSVSVNRKLSAERLDIVRKYATQALHPELFAGRWRDEWLAEGFRKAIHQQDASVWKSMLTEHVPGQVYSFQMVTEEFCDMFLEEVFNFYKSGLPARRPNSMNAYGIILNDIGLEPLIDELQRQLQPLGELLFPGPGSCWDGHHCFIVRYRSGEDLGLDMHTDDSDVTMNLCLGLEFAGAGLQFCGMVGATDHRKHCYTYYHKKGTCVIHLGRRRHGADDITSGERLNLILWNHSSTYRASDESENPDYLIEEGPPDAVCVSYTHDRDFGNFKEYPAGKEHFRGRGWCPRRKLEYEGFAPDCEEEVAAPRS